MLNVLINAYAISPNWGSEQGVGWNWVTNIARYCNCFVITEAEYKEEIEKAVSNHPCKEHLHFYYNAVSPEVRRMCWNQGDWRFYLHYAKWQKRTLEIARQICKTEKIDIIHHLNMICFREPGYLWKIDNIPFVWGPVGGISRLPLSLTKGMGLKHLLFYLIKNTITFFQSRFSIRVRKAIRHSEVIIAATQPVYDCFTNYYKHTNVVFINETGLNLLNSESVEHDYNHDTLELLWVGRLISSKRLDIALNAISKCEQNNIHLTIVGTGDSAEVSRYHSIARELGIEDKLSWLGRVDNEKVQILMKEKDVFFFTSILEATSTVVPEAISNNLPIICFNACGFGHLVKDRVGETIELQNPDAAAIGFAWIIDKFAKDRRLLSGYSSACDKYKLELSWGHKAERVVELYEQILKVADNEICSCK